MVFYELQRDEVFDFEGVLKNHRLVIVEAYSLQDGRKKEEFDTLKELSQKYKSAYFVTFDVQKCKDIAKLVGVSSWPTFYIYKDGIQIHEITGIDTERLNSLIKITLYHITPASPVSPASFEASSISAVLESSNPSGDPLFQSVSYKTKAPGGVKLSIGTQQGYPEGAWLEVLSPKSQVTSAEETPTSSRKQNPIDSALESFTIASPVNLESQR